MATVCLGTYLTLFDTNGYYFWAVTITLRSLLQVLRYLVIESCLSPKTISFSYSILTLRKNSFRIFFLEKLQQYVDEQKKRKLGKQTKK